MAVTDYSIVTMWENNIFYSDITHLRRSNDGMNPLTFERSQLKVCGIA
jgi:hypothetical protein